MAHYQAGLLCYPYHGWGFLITGWHGVEVFFVLSGYLITSRLFREDSLKHFYIRRIFRLWPTAWMYLALLFAVRFIHWDDVMPCIFFYRNFVFLAGKERALTGHFWTLSIEEQFYLVWPAVLFLSGRRALWFAAIGICAFGLCSKTWPYSALLTGCVLAFAVTDNRVRKWAQNPCIFPFSLIGFGWCIATKHWVIPFYEPFLIAAMLGSTSLNPQSRASRVLEQKTLAKIGASSYSMYVWQEVLLVTHSGGLGILFLPIVTLMSYKFIERPCIDFGARIIRRSRATELSPSQSSAVV